MSSSVQSNKHSKRPPLTVRELVIFAMLGAIMFCSKKVMEGLPNIHLVGMLTIAYTVVYRFKALIPIYIYVLLDGLFLGFSLWWAPYLYIWAILWGVTMLIPKKTPKWLSCIIYPVLCSLHGLFFGTLFAPAHALFYNLSFEQMLAWISAGLAFDIVHAIGNLVVGLLAFPLVVLLRKLEKHA